MASLNRVMLIGNLTKDPELRYSQNGLAIATFSIAVNNIYTAQNGEHKKETDFIRIKVFGKQAENCAKYLNKGRPVFVEGRLHPYSWETPDGQKKSSFDVIANNIQFLGGSKPGESNDEAEGVNANITDTNTPLSDSQIQNEEVPF